MNAEFCIDGNRTPTSKCRQEKEQSEDGGLKKQGRLSTGSETPAGQEVKREK